MVFKLVPSMSSSTHETLAARGFHEVICSSDAFGTVLDACEHLRNHASTAADGTLSLPFWLVMQLFIPLVEPDDRTKWRIALWSRFIDASCLSPAAAAVLTSEHFDDTRKYSSLASLAAALRLARATTARVAASRRCSRS